MRKPVRSRSPQTNPQCNQVQELVDNKEFKILE